jgi:hypothetical protein
MKAYLLDEYGRIVADRLLDLQEVVEMATKDGVRFPVPSDVLRYLKGFQ